MNTGLKMASAINLYMPFRTGVYPTPGASEWLAAGTLLFAQTGEAPVQSSARVRPGAMWIGIRIGV